MPWSADTPLGKTDALDEYLPVEVPGDWCWKAQFEFLFSLLRFEFCFTPSLGSNPKLGRSVVSIFSLSKDRFQIKLPTPIFTESFNGKAQANPYLTKPKSNIDVPFLRSPFPFKRIEVVDA